MHWQEFVYLRSSLIFSALIAFSFKLSHPLKHFKSNPYMWSPYWEIWTSCSPSQSKCVLVCYGPVNLPSHMIIIHVYPHYSGWEVNFLMDVPFPQCTGYIYIDIYEGLKIFANSCILYIYIYSGTPLIRPPMGHKNLVILTGWLY